MPSSSTNENAAANSGDAHQAEFSLTTVARGAIAMKLPGTLNSAR